MQQGINIASYQNNIPAIKTKRGRPKGKTQDSFSDITITPVVNGYLVTSSSIGKEVFVFEDITRVFEFIKAKLKPTGEQQKFLEEI